jgi:hypothetical protein
MRLFRERLLARLVERHAISEDLARKLFAWKHSGFSAHVGQPIPFEDKKAIEDVACYLVRAPLSLKKLVYLDGHKAALYRSRINPSLGRNFEAMDPLEWLARLADHIPDPGRHRTHFYAHYANRVRGERPSEELRSQEQAEEQPEAPLLAKLAAAYRQGLSGRPARVQTLLGAAQRDSLRHRSALDPEDPRPPRSQPAGQPPPDVGEVVRVPVDDEGREIAANPA